MITFGLWLLGKFKSLSQLLITHWRIVLVVLMALVIWHYKSAYENEKQDFTEYIALVKQEAELQAQKNQIIEANTQKAVSLEVNKYKSIIATLDIDRAQLQKKVSSLYANKTNADYRLASYADRMLLEAGSRNTTGEIASDTERLAGCGRELDATDSGLSVIEQACAVTTAQFNLARGWIDGVCSNHDCSGVVE